ncbi:hypothetical protein DICPUDRAFT_25816 [Dictyostelium purpureum]|uniref:Radical SAM core domain-containing protein n=1 Tax=Dictyostelium purpureum TaxID=5786 RepID=F0Z7P0_DICPU|nr:uncharacterized protein DICPUDRAFT_25816 [Dictyostelium purpureum]EGC40098.1 hypothetical protein DICPUDRAFT_25816 [Dictyostelium purpureum]|eukprot:XP_003283447.1 hypothetical protein DICPUDRAFT_25816 [Dictyostelium purpureum]
MRRFLINNNSSFIKRDCNSFSKIKNFNPNNDKIIPLFSTTLNNNENKNKINIIGLPKLDLIEKFEKLNFPKYSVDQVWKLMYNKGIDQIKDFNLISKERKSIMEENFKLDTGTITKHQLSVDGTRKFLISFDGDEVESVFIPESSRGTLCVSSQVGCTFACTFCFTGTQKFKRNLTANEIVAQVVAARKLLNDFNASEERLLTNIVFMGQGEPFYNYRNVKKAISIITDSNGLAIGKSKITVSTSGVVPIIERLGTDFPGIGLAISLHSPNDEVRSKIVTANRQWPIEELVQSCIKFSKTTKSRITLEYVPLQDVHDTEQDALDLIPLCKRFPSLVNIIPFNPWPGSPHESSTNNQIQIFANILESNNVKTTIRQSRGRDIMAACGQLKS